MMKLSKKTMGSYFHMAAITLMVASLLAACSPQKSTDLVDGAVYDSLVKVDATGQPDPEVETKVAASLQLAQTRATTNTAAAGNTVSISPYGIENPTNKGAAIIDLAKHIQVSETGNRMLLSWGARPALQSPIKKVISCKRSRTLPLGHSHAIDHTVDIKLTIAEDNTMQVDCSLSKLNLINLQSNKSCAIPVAINGAASLAKNSNCEGVKIPEGLVKVYCSYRESCDVYGSCKKPVAERKISIQQLYTLNILESKEAPWVSTSYSNNPTYSSESKRVVDGKVIDWDCQLLGDQQML